jgi:hypothetical protein
VSDARVEAVRAALVPGEWALFSLGTVVVFPAGGATAEAAVAVLHSAIDHGDTVEVGAVEVSDGHWLAIGGHPDVLTFVSAAQLGGGPRDPSLIGQFGDHLRRRDAEAPQVVHLETAGTA